MAQEPNTTTATGTWKWSTRTPNGQAFETTLRLKQDGEKLTGVQLGRGGEVPIRDGQIKENKVSFRVIRERPSGDPIVFKYEGTLKGETIEGKTESNFGGENRTSDWVAKRQIVQPKPAARVSGTWQWTFATPAGQTFEPRVRLSQSGDKLTGAIIWGETESPIQDGVIEEEVVTFKVVRERGGRTVTTKYKGKLSGDSIQGKIESDWGGDVQTFDWNAKRVGGP
ncbi:MAG: hypothetical protein HY735_02065 [Verrucomicrobia bacterium]|nr:hypothetical protein [Verrucomicrobiota bacterium]